MKRASETQVISCLGSSESPPTNEAPQQRLGWLLGRLDWWRGDLLRVLAEETNPQSRDTLSRVIEGMATEIIRR